MLSTHNLKMESQTSKPLVLVRECFRLIRQSTIYIKSCFVNRQRSLRQKSRLTSQFLRCRWGGQGQVNGSQWALKWAPLALCAHRQQGKPRPADTQCCCWLTQSHRTVITQGTRTKLISSEMPAPQYLWRVHSSTPRTFQFPETTTTYNSSQITN